MRLISDIALLALVLISAPVARSEEAAKAAEKPMQMESYQLVLLKRGPNWTPEPTPEVLELQKQHLAHMAGMAEAGNLVIAGPFGDQQDPAMRGMCLYRVDSVDEARRLASLDPMVKAGRLTVEAMTWWVEKGHVEFPKAPPRAAPPAPAR